MAEHSTHNALVVGSNPTRPTFFIFINIFNKKFFFTVVFVNIIYHPIMAIPQLQFEYYPIHIIHSIFLFCGFCLVYQWLLKDLVQNIRKKIHNNQNLINKTNEIKKKDQEIIKEIIINNQEQQQLINENNYIQDEKADDLLWEYKNQKQKEVQEEIKNFVLQNQENVENLLLESLKKEK